MDMRPTRAALLAGAATGGVLLALSLWHALGRAAGTLVVVLVSFFVSAACEPVVNKLAARGMRRGAATALLLGGVLVLVTLGAVAAGTAILGQIQDLRAAAPQLADDLQETVLRWTGMKVDLAGLASRLSEREVSDAVTGVAAAGLRLIGNILTGLLVSFYLIVDGPRLRKRLCSMLPQEHQAEVLRIWDLAVEKTGGYLASKVILAGIATAVHAALFTVLGVPYALPMAIWVGLVSQIVPVIGTYLAIGFPMLLVLADGRAGVAVGVLLLATVYQQIENSWLTPRLTAQAVDVHPAIGFVSVLAVGAAFGPAYTLLTIPLVATISGFVSAYVKTHTLIDDPRLITGQIPVVAGKTRTKPTKRNPVRRRRSGR